MRRNKSTKKWRRVPRDLLNDGDKSTTSSEEVYYVEEILNKRKRSGRTEYLVKWKGYDSDENTWEPPANLGQNVIEEYETNLKSYKKGKKGKRSRVSKSPNGNTAYEVEKILDRRVLEDGNVEYFIKWKGCGDEVSSWEPHENLNCNKLVEAFEKDHNEDGDYTNTKSMLSAKPGTSSKDQSKRKFEELDNDKGSKRAKRSSSAARKTTLNSDTDQIREHQSELKREKEERESASIKRHPPNLRSDKRIKVETSLKPQTPIKNVGKSKESSSPKRPSRDQDQARKSQEGRKAQVTSVPKATPSTSQKRPSPILTNAAKKCKPSVEAKGIPLNENVTLSIEKVNLGGKSMKLMEMSESERGSSCGSIEANEGYQVEEVISAKIGNNGGLEYHIKWRGYGPEDNTWVSREDMLSEHPKALIEFENRKGTKRRSASLKRSPSEPKSLKGTVVPEFRSRRNTFPKLRTRVTKKAEKGKSGFGRGFVAEKILAAFLVSGKLMYRMKWKYSDDVDTLPAEQVKAKCPKVVFDYYESLLTFTTEDEELKGEEEEIEEEEQVCVKRVNLENTSLETITPEHPRFAMKSEDSSQIEVYRKLNLKRDEDDDVEPMRPFTSRAEPKNRLTPIFSEYFRASMKREVSSNEQEDRSEAGSTNVFQEENESEEDLPKYPIGHLLNPIGDFNSEISGYEISAQYEDLIDEEIDVIGLDDDDEALGLQNEDVDRAKFEKGPSQNASIKGYSRDSAVIVKCEGTKESNLVDEDKSNIFPPTDNREMENVKGMEKLGKSEAKKASKDPKCPIKVEDDEEMDLKLQNKEVIIDFDRDAKTECIRRNSKSQIAAFASLEADEGSEFEIAKGTLKDEAEGEEIIIGLENSGVQSAQDILERVDSEKSFHATEISHEIHDRLRIEDEDETGEEGKRLHSQNEKNNLEIADSPESRSQSEVIGQLDHLSDGDAIDGNVEDQEGEEVSGHFSHSAENKLELGDSTYSKRCGLL